MSKKIQYNSPVILTFAIVSFGALILNMITNGWSNRLLFSVYRSSFGNPFTYIRLFGHVLGHANLQHYTGNMMMILLLGPMIEERYGSITMLKMMGITAFVTGIINSLLFPRIALCGASGIVFLLIVLSSMVNFKEGEIPLTLILVLVVYLGEEIVNGLFSKDNISQLAHIIGGLCGCGFGFMIGAKRKNNV